MISVVLKFSNSPPNHHGLVLPGVIRRRRRHRIGRPCSAPAGGGSRRDLRGTLQVFTSAAEGAENAAGDDGGLRRRRRAAEEEGDGEGGALLLRGGG